MHQDTPGEGPPEDASSEREATAQELAAAERTHRPAAGLTSRRPGTTLDEAYAIQHLNVRARQEDGARIVGHKVGLTSAAMREQMGVNEPDSGVLLDDMQVPHNGTLRVGDLLTPRVEAEIGFRLGRDLAGTDVDADQARGAIAESFLALEIIDSRYGAWNLTVLDSIADNASSARFAIGAPAAHPPRDLRATAVTLLIDGAEQARGLASAVMGDPVEALAWLARRLDRSGLGLRAGQVVLAGSVHSSLALRPGQHIEAAAPTWPSVRLHTT